MENNRLNKIRQFFKQHRRLPSYSEMLKLFNLRSKNAVHKVVKKWLEEGLLEKINNKIVASARFFQLPVYGLVKAGFPTPAEEDIEFMSLEDYLIDDPQASFLLKIDGDSLINIGIFPGDLAVIKKQNEAKPEDIVLALIDGQWTLKIFKKKNKKVWLEAANPKYPPFYPREELKIYGVVKAITRKIS